MQEPPQEPRNIELELALMQWEDDGGACPELPPREEQVPPEQE